MFKTAAEAYEFADVADVHKTQKRFVAFFRKGDLVLDIGCGRGIFMSLLKEAGCVPVGIDILPEAVEICKKAGQEAYCADLFSFLPDKKDQYNGIFASHIIEHLPVARVHEFIQYCYEALKPDGILLLVTPNFRDLRVVTEVFWLDLTHVRPYPLPLLRSLTAAHGFTTLYGGENTQRIKLFQAGTDRKNRLLSLFRKITTFGLSGQGDLYIVCQKIGQDKRL